MLIRKFMVVMFSVTFNTKIGITRLTVFAGSVVFTQFTNNLLLQLSIPFWVYFKVSNILRETFGLWVINNIGLLELLGRRGLVINAHRIELRSH